MYAYLEVTSSCLSFSALNIVLNQLVLDFVWNDNTYQRLAFILTKTIRAEPVFNAGTVF